MATVTNYPIDVPILVIEAQIFVAVNKFQFLPNKLIPINDRWQLLVELPQSEQKRSDQEISSQIRV